MTLHFFQLLRIHLEACRRGDRESRLPGIAATLLMVVTTIVAAMGLSREKETGTLEQVMVTPMSPETLLMGKVAPYAVIGLIDLALVVIVGAAVFNVPMRGGFHVLFAAGAPGSAVLMRARM